VRDLGSIATHRRGAATETAPRPAPQTDPGSATVTTRAAPTPSSPCQHQLVRARLPAAAANNPAGSAEASQAASQPDSPHVGAQLVPRAPACGGRRRRTPQPSTSCCTIFCTLCRPRTVLSDPAPLGLRGGAAPPPRLGGGVSGQRGHSDGVDERRLQVMDRAPAHEQRLADQLVICSGGTDRPLAAAPACWLGTASWTQDGRVVVQRARQLPSPSREHELPGRT
jgi:hypothetical protein